MRKKADRQWYFNISSLPYRISFFLWRVWIRKLPIGDVLTKNGIDIFLRCRCCENPQPETIIHLFLIGESAKSFWSLSTGASAVQGPFIQLNQAITQWWNGDYATKLKPLYQVAQTIIMWQLWKRIHHCPWRDNVQE